MTDCLPGTRAQALDKSKPQIDSLTDGNRDSRMLGTQLALDLGRNRKGHIHFAKHKDGEGRREKATPKRPKRSPSADGIMPLNRGNPQLLQYSLNKCPLERHDTNAAGPESRLILSYIVLGTRQRQPPWHTHNELATGDNNNPVGPYTYPVSIIHRCDRLFAQISSSFRSFRPFSCTSFGNVIPPEFSTLELFA